jgi:hypothetical protein
MLSDVGAGLARADRSIAEAENNIRQLGSLLPQLVESGYQTGEVETQIALMTRVLDELKTQRWQIEGMLGEP